MGAASVMDIGIKEEMVGVAPAVVDRLAEYFADVASGLVRSEQRWAAEYYARALMMEGARKSLEPMVTRMGGTSVEYEALQHFLADSPWDPAVIDRAVAERVCAVIEPMAWVLDDTGVPKYGRHSPGVKRQYSGTLGKIGSCQIAVSLHAVSTKGTVPLGFRLYVPEDWCQDPVRRREAKIPASVDVCRPSRRSAVSWSPGRRAGRSAARRCSAIRHTATTPSSAPACTVTGSTTCSRSPRSATCLIPARCSSSLSASPARVAPRPARLPPTPSRGRSTSSSPALTPRRSQPVAFRDIDGGQLVSRFAFVRVIAAHPVTRDRQAPREEWLIVEWPEGHEHPSDYWISNLPADTEPEQLARLARLRWMIELDYKQLKGELGLDHYEGRSYLGFHHHCSLVTAAHGFLTLERADPNRPRPA